MREGVFQPFHQFGFLVRQFVRILRVDGQGSRFRVADAFCHTGRWCRLRG